LPYADRDERFATQAFERCCAIVSAELPSIHPPCRYGTADHYEYWSVRTLLICTHSLSGKAPPITSRADRHALGSGWAWGH